MSNTEPKEDPESHTQDEPLLQSVARALGTAVGVVASALTPSANEGEKISKGKTKHEQRAEPSTQSRISRRSMNKKAKKKKHRRKLRRSHTNG
jgi:hypothetical protein